MPAGLRNPHSLRNQLVGSKNLSCWCDLHHSTNVRVFPFYEWLHQCSDTLPRVALASDCRIGISTQVTSLLYWDNGKVSRSKALSTFCSMGMLFLNGIKLTLEPSANPILSPKTKHTIRSSSDSQIPWGLLREDDIVCIWNVLQNFIWKRLGTLSPESCLNLLHSAVG